ncbi:MAG: cephalosporin hydroxylase family protein [Fimbriimonadales bacterium]
MAADPEVGSLRKALMERSYRYRHTYQHSWLGRPIIQYPEDLMAMQEIIWEVKPHVIVETGIAHGGSLIFYASMLELLGNGGVVGVDIDIREHNRVAIESHPLAARIEMIQGSSTSLEVVAEVEKRIGGRSPVMVVLDSNHTHDHVLRELELYSLFVSADSYVVVFDTIVEDLPPGMFPDRPWDVGDNPLTAIRAFLGEHPEFAEAATVSNKLLLSVARGGYLQRIS